jgi:hypothetical protein
MVLPYGFPPTFTFITRYGFYTQTLAWMLDSLVRVSRRAARDHYANVLAEAQTSVSSRYIPPRAITLLPKE